jgi:hypothetical protein
MAGEEFNPAELLPKEKILDEINTLLRVLADRVGIEEELLSRLAHVVNNQGLNIFLFILLEAPVSRKQLKRFFPSTTLERWLPRLEGAGVILYRNYRYWIRYPSK